jgi:hypothetical protein
MVQVNAQIRHDVVDRNYNGALAALRRGKDKEAYKEQDRVVYWMNEGMLLHLLGRYKESNKVLTKAEVRSKELYTRSIRKDVKAAFTSDAAKDYVGEDYENVLVNVIKALNYLALGDIEGALVEARKINEKLKLYDTRHERANTYNQDAFAHWLMGILFEMEGSYDDARIAFSNAMKVYEADFARNYDTPPPSYVAEDMVRAALEGGDTDLANKMRQDLGDTSLGGTYEALKEMGEIVLINFNGEGPIKSDYVVTCWFRSPVAWACDGQPGGEFIKRTRITVPPDGTVIKVAFPELHTHEPRDPWISIKVGDEMARTEVALPISRIARKVLADKMHIIFRDAIIRMITKTAVAVGAGEAGKAAGGALGGWLAKTATSATFQALEEADKRAWTTLPSEIDVARLLVPPGTHTVHLRTRSGRRRDIPGVKVAKGKHTVVTIRTMP